MEHVTRLELVLPDWKSRTLTIVLYVRFVSFYKHQRNIDYKIYQQFFFYVLLKIIYCNMYKYIHIMVYDYHIMYIFHFV